jgi:Zinc carboxypeptidase
VTPYLPELQQLESIIQQNVNALRVEVLQTVALEQLQFPIYALSMGSTSTSAPCITFVGGIHGLERIGTQVVLAFLETLLERLHWDVTLRTMLAQVRIEFVPLVNPIGMYKRMRANGHGVDLMRNAPVDSVEQTVWLAGGHRISPSLPWYRGAAGDAMQVEAQVLCDFIQQRVLTAPFSMYHLRKLFFQTYPYQNYCFEPQALHYLTHGDLWDYLYLQSLSSERVFLPLTLEMGSWRWIRKNPLQLFKLLGMFHPIKAHRISRVLRGHLILMEFLVRATLSYEHWSDQQQHQKFALAAQELWYREPS